MKAKISAAVRLGFPLWLLPGLLMGCAHGVAADAMAPIAIEEWKVPYGGRPRDPFAAGADAIWFVGQSGHYLARFTPSTAKFFRRELPDAPGPHNLIVGSGGIVFYAGNLEGYIGRYDPAADTIRKFPMPNPDARDPHTLVFSAGQRQIWFTVQGGNFVGRLTLATGAVELIKVPSWFARPYGIKMAPDGTPWIVLLGTNKLASVDAKTLKLTEYEIPASGARPRRLEITPDGRVWYADFRRGYLGRYDPKTKKFKEWPLPAGPGSRPYGMALDKHERIWLVETGVRPNTFVGFDTRKERVFSITPIPSGAGSVRHMDYHPPTNTVWFGTDAGTLGRALVKGE